MTKRLGLIHVLPCAHEIFIPEPVLKKSHSVDVITCTGCTHGWYYLVISNECFVNYKDTAEEIANLYNSCSGKETKYSDAYGYFYYKELNHV